LLTDEAIVNPAFGRTESILRDIIVTCGPCTENLKQSKEVQTILGKFGPPFTDSIGDYNPPIPFEFDYKGTIRESFPSLSVPELGMLINFLDCMLQIDPDRRETPSVLLSMPWLL
jgi:hypothetical protein